VADLPVRLLWGVGKRAEERLHTLGCRTCGDLRKFSEADLCQQFGKFGSELYLQCRGIDNRPVVPSRVRKSLSNERTYGEPVEFEEDLDARIAGLFEELVVDLAVRPELRDKVAGPFVKVKFTDFSQTTLGRAGAAWDLETIRSLAREAFARKDLPARLLGVGVRFLGVGSSLEQLELPLRNRGPADAQDSA